MERRRLSGTGSMARQTPEWEATNAFSTVPKGGLTHKDVKNEGRSDYVYENKARQTKCHAKNAVFYTKMHQSHCNRQQWSGRFDRMRMTDAIKRWAAGWRKPIFRAELPVPASPGAELSFCGKRVTIFVVGATLTLKTMALVAVLLCALPLKAQAIANCQGDPLLEKQIAQQPSADALNALGVYLTGHKSSRCGEAAFKRALEIDARHWRARLNLGLAYLSDGQNASAVEQLRTAETDKPDSVEVHNALGSAWEALGKMPEAQAQFDAALALDPRSDFALFHRGLTLEGQRRLTAAINSYQRALEISPANIDYSCALANAYVQSGDANKALSTLQPLTDAHSDSALLWYNLGVVYSRTQNAQSAIDSLERSLHLDPKNDNTIKLLAHNLIDASRFQEAEPLANDLVKSSPNNSEYLYIRALIYRGEGRFSLAIADLEKAAARDRNNFDVEYNLGFCLQHSGRPQEAELHLKAAMAIQPESSGAKFQLMNVYRSQGRTDLARKLADKLQSEKSATVQHDLGNTYGAKANASMSSGKYQEAIAQYRLALDADPRNAQTFYNLSVAQRQVGDRAGEKSSLSRALELSPDLSLAHDALGATSLTQGDKVQARREFERGLELDPQCASCKIHLGTMLLKTAEDRRGRELLRQAVEDDPESEEAHRAYGMLLASIGSLPEAREQLTKAVALSPNSAESLSDLGMVQGKMSDPGAVDTLARVVKLHPDWGEGHLNLGIALADQHRLDEALAEFSESIRLAPGDARGHYNKGRALTDLNRDQEAAHELKAACRLDPAIPRACYDAAVAERKNGELSAALDTLKKTVAAQPKDADGFLLLGQTYQDLGQTSAAVQAWEAAVQLEPHSREGLYKLSRALEKSDPKLSATYRDRFKSLESSAQIQNRASSLGRIASEAAKAGNWPLAVSDFDEALRVCGACELAWQLRKDLGLSLCNSGDLVRGEKELRSAFQQSPDDPDIKYALELIERSRAK